MHNLSNEYFQNEFETDSNEYGYELSPEFEFGNENEFEYEGEPSYELSPEFEFEFENADMEMNQSEFTQELMEISNEAEFGSWLRNIGNTALGAASGILNTVTGQKATAALGNIAKKTLPGFGAKIGGSIGGLFGNAALGQLQGQQFGAKAAQAAQAATNRYPQFVKFAADTLKNLKQKAETGAIPAIKPAIVKAAKKHYPIILKVKGTLHARPIMGKLSNEFEYSNEYGSGYSNEFDNEYSGEFEGENGYEMEGEISENEGTFNEVSEMELASELLSLQSEAELDMFFGKLFKKAVGAVKKFAKSGTGKALGGMLKGLVKKALPVAGGALGSFFAPGIGTAIGSKLGTAAGNLFELELEGLSPEDREFETARAFVRFAGNSARRASRLGNMNPAAAARRSIIHSARRYAPGLLARGNRVTNVYNNNADATGTWYRDGNRIIIDAV